MNTENTDKNIFRYLKFIVISRDARTQTNRDGVFQKESLQRHSLELTFFYGSCTIFFQGYLYQFLALKKYLSI